MLPRETLMWAESLNACIETAEERSFSSQSVLLLRLMKLSWRPGGHGGEHGGEPSGASNWIKRLFERIVEEYEDRHDH